MPSFVPQRDLDHMDLHPSDSRDVWTFDQRATSGLSNICDRVYKHDGNLLSAQAEWYTRAFFLGSSASGYPSTLHSQSSTVVKHARESLEELEKVFSFVEQLRLILGAQCQSARRDVDALALRTGFSSLPDDLVAEILVFATRPLKIIPNVHIDIVAEMQALAEARTLSHVCRRFRSLVLNRSQIWGVISERMNSLSEVTFCTQHSKTAPMTVVVEHFGVLQSSGRSGFPQKINSRFQAFFETCLLSSNRWRSLILGKNSYPDTAWTSFRWTVVRTNLLSISQITKNLILPAIQRLSVDYSTFPSQSHLDAELHPYLRWSMPKLTELKLSGCHPPPAQTTFSCTLRSLSIHFNTKSGPAYSMSKLTSFLSSCKVLETVNLHFVDWTSVANMSDPPFAVTKVQKVLLSFYKCTSAIVTAICGAIHFPEATTLRLTLSDLRFVPTSTNGHQESASSKYESLIRAFLLRHPSIESLELSFHPYMHAYTPIVPPIQVLPELEVLSLSFGSWKELVFWKDTTLLATAFRIPPIRRLELTGFDLEEDWPSVNKWVERFFARMKWQDDLDAYEMFTIFCGDRRRMESCQSGVAAEVCAYLPYEKISFLETR
ncbi:hypothetical protein SCHPADRAFT_928745 [Schizopora paradoxa]|uniref:F-box domain-containing protein n=1 Tax=Schizopora paradoxa TaxID=27342 RepID=A0A0H2RMI4_9AGAM|nr:hypothetical protein SCHPADRAFT_928745 [Schizopora paradoxa]